MEQGRCNCKELASIRHVMAALGKQKNSRQRSIAGSNVPVLFFVPAFVVKSIEMLRSNSRVIRLSKTAEFVRMFDECISGNMKTAG